MNRNLIIAVSVLGLSLTTLLPSVYAADPRQPVELPSMMQEHMLSNMRDHLLAISEIQTALAAGKFEQARHRRASHWHKLVAGAWRLAYGPVHAQAHAGHRHRDASRGKSLRHCSNECDDQ